MNESNENTGILEAAANEFGVAVVVVDETSTDISLSNNNSICQQLYPSAEFGPRCREFCGQAFGSVMEAGTSISYRCHAGLDCTVVPVRSRERRRAIIVGRTFVSTEGYRNAAERAATGDWQQFKPESLFENVLISASASAIEKAVHRLEILTDDERASILALEKSAGGVEGDEVQKPGVIVTEDAREIATPGQGSTVSQSTEEIAVWRSFFGALLKLDYRQACMFILEFLRDRYRLPSLMWVEWENGSIVPVSSVGRFADRSVIIDISADDPRLVEAARSNMPLELIERRPSSIEKRKKLALFPIRLGGEIHAALAVNGTACSVETKERISRFCQAVGPQLEIVRLRDEVARRDVLARAVKKFNGSLKRIDADDFWMHVTRLSAEILDAERASLLVRESQVEGLEAKASLGARIDLRSETDLGRRVARMVLDEGRPVVVSDVQKVGLGSAPAERRYKTGSFLSYPIAIGDRGVGIMNFTDKAGGDPFSERDVQLLDAIAPQIAIALDRTSLKHRAGQLEQLSITDPLTGLLNRRYIEERLAEELKRSTRHGYPMSFMMVDVDEFKAYNDRFGHPAGDEALKIVGHALRDTLRGADVAARYGGEEFSILLPQTTSEEAETIAERIRRRIEKSTFRHRRVTVSIGIASCSSTVASVADLISAADKALYRAKSRGRNNVQIFSESDNDAAGNIH